MAEARNRETTKRQNELHALPRQQPETAYRFALYGHTGYGKTCYLAAMWLGAPGQPSKQSKLTVEHLPPAAKLGYDEALLKGEKLVGKAADALSRNQLPDPTPPMDKPYPEVIFRVGSPQDGPRQFRLADYSGELINPEDLKDPKTLANRLQEHLAQYEGFVVLAEVPRPGQAVQFSGELQRLQEAFAVLHEAKQMGQLAPLAITVVFTKWDRYSEINFDHPEEEAAKLRQFLKEHPKYRDLVNACANIVSQQPDLDASLREAPSGATAMLLVGNLAVFAASVFGSAVEQNGKETPPPQGIRCFGLLDPLVWLARRRDQLDLEHLRDNYQQADQGRLRWFKSRPFCQLATEARRAARRMPRKSPLRSQVESLAAGARSRCWRGRVLQALALLSLVALTLDLTVGARNRAQFNDNRRLATGSQTTLEELRKAAAWFRQAYLRPYRGLLIGPSRSACRVQWLRAEEKVQKRCESMWKGVERIEDPIERARQAERFLTRCPDADYDKIQKANTYIIQSRQAENDHRIKEWQSRFHFLQSSPGNFKVIQELKALLKECTVDNLPHKDDASLAQRYRIQNLRDCIRKEITRREGEITWDQFVADVKDLVNSKDYPGAVEHLLTWEPRDDRWRNFAAKILNQIVSRLAEDIRTRTGRIVEIRDLRSEINEVRDTLQNHEEQFQKADLDITTHLQELNRLLGALDRKEDRLLYDQVVRFRDEESCKRYIDEAPVGTMTRQVTGYLRYLQSLKGTWSATVSVELQIDSNYSTGDGTGEFYFYRPQIGDYTAGRLPGGGTVWIDPGEKKVVTRDIRLRLEPNASVPIQLELWEEDRGPDDPAGRGRGRFTREELRKGVTIRLTEQGHRWTNQARIKVVDGLPQEPPLPPYPRSDPAK